MTVERRDPPQQGPEKEMLEGYLEYHRATLLLKCDGLTDEQLRRHAVPTSNLTLLGMVRHLAEVELWWFRTIFLGDQHDPVFFSDERPNDDFDDLEGAPVADVFDRYRANCEAARDAVASAALDDLSERTGRRTSEPFSLRWIMLHMIEEYARHNGHADLLREAIDGQTGE